MTSYEIAIAAYERAFALVTQRAGESYAQPSVATDLLDRAEQLALPGLDRATNHALQPLRSILGRLERENKIGYYRPVAIGISLPDQLDTSPILPLAKQVTIQPADYVALWRQLQEEHKRLLTTNQSEMVREVNLLALLQRFCWAVPAPVAKQNDIEIDDVSLYDFARVSAALAVCLQARPADAGAAEPVALLIGGDVSGVQEWLYTLSSDGAARNLRGRSFYLQLLSEVIALYLLRELHLPSCNLLYVGGGNFYLLAPVTCSADLTRIQQQISERLLKMHEGALYIAIGQATISETELSNDQIGAVWKRVSQAMGRAKARRFAELGDQGMAAAIGSPQSGDDDPLNTCAVCRRVIMKEENPIQLDDGSRKCELCGSFEGLGLQLRHAEFLVVSQVESAPIARANSWPAGLAQFGYNVQLCWAKNADHLQEWQSVMSELVRLYFWRGKSGFPGTLNNDKTAWIFRPLGQCIPIHREQDRVADFSELHAIGIARWGTLRMDVDNLGSIFQHGLPSGNLCRVVSLSGLLRLFFEGHVPALAQRINREFDERALYLMYAGGDDLFVVGGWSHLPTLAAAIRHELEKFACGNPKVTISGGISIALADKYPLYQAARDAGVAEDLAKDLPDKDGLAFWGQAVKWGAEYDSVRNRVIDLVEWCEPQVSRRKKQIDSIEQEGQRRKYPLPRSFLMNLRSIENEWRDWKRRENKLKQHHGATPRYEHINTELYLGPWQWHLVYSLYRAAERTRDNDLKRDVKELAESIVKGEIRTIGLSTRWAELLTRR